MESIQKHREYSSTTNSAVFSPSFVYNQIRYDQGCENGTNIERALTLIENQGVAKLNQFAFDCNKPITNRDRDHAKAYKIKDYKTLFTLYSNNKIQPVKKALSEKKPVIIGMRTPNSFNRAKDIWQPTQSDYQRQKFGGHAMVVVGYDDNKYGGSFQLMNSWGSRWGNNGFTWIRYRDFKHFVKYAYEMIPNPPPQEPIRLGGELRFVDSNGNEMSATYNHTRHLYQMNRPYKSGTRFNFFIKNAQPASSGGSVSQRLKAVLGSGLIDGNSINFANNSVKFSYSSSRGVKLKNNDSIIAVIIKFKYT